MKIKCAYHLCQKELMRNTASKNHLRLCGVLFMQRNSESIVVIDVPNMTRWHMSFN